MELWGCLKKFSHEDDNGNTIYFRDQIKTRLLNCKDKIKSSYGYHKGKRVPNTTQLSGVYEELFEIQCLMADKEYELNLDLPKAHSGVQKAIRAV